MSRILFTSVCLVVVLLIASAFMQASGLPQSIERGKEVYTTYCQNCHMENGAGVPGANPPLAKSDYLKHPVNDLIKLVVKGQTGKIIVNGTTYETPMLAVDYLTDEQVADVLNYVRNTWGNKNAVAVLPSQVKKMRN